MSDLKVAVIQSDIAWENKMANYQHFANQIKQLSGEVDLVVLPEMFNVGFTPNMAVAITDQSKVVEWMSALALEKQLALTGSVVVENDEGEPVNRMFFITEKGEVHYYDKMHLFVLFDEAKLLQPGKKRSIVEYKGFRILLSICFDLRFPVFNCNNNDFDLMINIASWPAKRRMHWRTLLQARAIENQSYVIGCNRIGVDGLDFAYSGDSMCVHFDGEIVAELGKAQAGLIYHQFNLESLQVYREKFQVLASQDRFRLLPYG